jgi:predicted secreted hydrolase
MENWKLAGGESDLLPLRIRAQEEAIALDLTLNSGKPLVLQGDRGLSQKSAKSGNASYYYSYSRLPTQGTIQISGQSFTVNGASWLDREWSTSALGPEQSGWDWFALQLDDGRELMFYRLRRKYGGTDRFSQGVLIAADGQTRPLRPDAVDLQPMGEWQSPQTGDRYSAGWRLRSPAEHLDLSVQYSPIRSRSLVHRVSLTSSRQSLVT